MKNDSISEDLARKHLQYLDFWTKFQDFVRAKDPNIYMQTPGKIHWHFVSAGSPYAHIVLTISTLKSIIRCELSIYKNKDLFNLLQERKEEIEKEIGEKAEWVNAAVLSRIMTSKKVTAIFDKTETEKHHEWLYEKTVLFKKVFRRYLQEYRNRME